MFLSTSGMFVFLMIVFFFFAFASSLISLTCSVLRWFHFVIALHFLASELYLKTLSKELKEGNLRYFAQGFFLGVFAKHTAVFFGRDISQKTLNQPFGNYLSQKIVWVIVLAPSPNILRCILRESFLARFLWLIFVREDVPTYDWWCL